MITARQPYPSDISDEESSLIIPYLLLMKENAEQRHHDLRELFNGLRYVIRYGIAWRAMPNDLPPWTAVYQQSRRWMEAGCFEAVVHDLWVILRIAAGRMAEPTTAIIDNRTLRSTPENGPRSGYDGAKRKNGSKVAKAAKEQDFTPEIVRLHQAKRGFVLLPRRWIVERSFAWTTRCRRLVKDYEHCASTLAAMHTIAFAGFMLRNVANLLSQSA
ncbi:transposase [Acetobacter fallax]|uniref:Transposase n=1 Tax=Acetobacter fallax TaxID=1737473 RepID=A0ABX0KFQ6_9PROT|nr:transposase [Acetobacter fallax]NHO34347.1 transposase [Acetobacter fallax]NHO37916.1 transposase [Acetobacter fallax]